jgi:putative MATE family efflux protein
MYHIHPTDSSASLDILLGNPKKAILYMVIPVFMALLVAQLNNFVDNIWCSSLGVEAVSAVSLVSTLYFFFPTTGAAIGVGLNVTISNLLGAADKESAGDRATQTLALVALISVAIIPILFLSMDSLIDLIGGSEIRDLCREYLIPLYLLCPFLVISNVIPGMLRGEGAAGRSTVINIIAAVTNMILDPIFIFGFDLGVAGASWATMLSSVVVVLIGLRYYYTGRTYVNLNFRGMRFKRSSIWDVMYVAIPQILENNAHALANLLLMALIIGCGGALGLTLYNVPWKTIHLLMVPSMAVSAAMIPVLSSARGQKDPERLKEGYLYAMKLCIGLALVATLVAFVFSDFWMLLFSYTGDMAGYHDELVRILWIYIPFMVFYALISFGSSLLSALRKSQISAITIFARQAIFVGIIWICTTQDMEWVYWGVTVSEIIGGILMTVIFRSEFKVVYRALQCPIHNPRQNTVKNN